MKGHNNCAWTKVGEAVLYGKSCCGTYCKVQLAKIRTGSRITMPCMTCDKGKQSEIQLCRACGRDKIRMRHLALEKRAKQQFSLVLSQFKHPIREWCCMLYAHLQCNMATMHEYIVQLLAEMQAPEPLNDVFQNIMDEPIPEAVKRRLLKPLLAGKHRLTAKARSNIQRKQNTI